MEFMAMDELKMMKPVNLRSKSEKIPKTGGKKDSFSVPE